MQLWQIIKREFRQIFLEDPRRFVFLFGAAVGYLFIFGALYSPNIVKYIPLIVYDEEQSPLSRELIRDFDSSDSFRVTAYAATQEEMQQALADKSAYAAIDIPRDFSRKIKQGGASSLLFMVNGSNIVITNITSSAAQDITAAFSDKVAAERAALRTGQNQEKLGKRLAPVSAHLRVLNNPTQGYMLFFLLGLAMAAFQQGIFFSVGASVQAEYLKREAISWRSLLLGKFITYWGLAMLSFLTVVLIAEFFWEIWLKGSMVQLLLLGGVFSFAFIAFSMLMSSLFHNEMQFVRASILYPVPAFIFAGYTWPQESLGPVMHLVSYFSRWPGSPTRSGRFSPPGRQPILRKISRCCCCSARDSSCSRASFSAIGRSSFWPRMKNKVETLMGRIPHCGILHNGVIILGKNRRMCKK